ncbi:malate/lactate/ureidoglycolate dehydrogenase [Siccirubricoccus sp. KC 17139]|uniref:Malate/lactate/ureidoglycolate dehydrogenase n=1 Tax=Siccirubricoccus soli TaxID=2899147 RepID=A0ABT1D9D1_9PROT|nr:malate/lactate/ureidoglycolate dehydrogenase [Siccirubricoccus soli]MCO6417600.1 malate/lactate/ureidoglycolate dehydrogenase [Siccirubricoccus soli]MCP2683735.1 malate/lactate/ureidoglycolate dehydrogenase [Siccirubricoccus soli]
MDTLPPVLVAADTLESLVASIFRATGCDAAEAGRIAHHLLGANLAGHDSHGVVRVPRYVEWQQAGYVVAGRQAEIVMDGGAFALLDAQFGFGQTVAPQATALGIERAKQHGTAVIALRNAGHVGRIGAYSEQALAEGLISIHFVNVAGSVLVAPFGGTERRFSTAPFSIGIPTDPPVVLDFATSLVAEGKVLVASNGGKPLPEGSLIEPDGTLSSDPHTLYGDYPQVGPRSPGNGLGAIRAFGEHKGSGLALMCELLAGAFTGGGCAGPITARGRIANGMLSIYISPRHFGTEAAFKQAAQDYVAWVKSCRPATPGEEVLAPGEKEAKLRKERLANGVPLQPDTWESIIRCARSLGVTVPN